MTMPTPTHIIANITSPATGGAEQLFGAPIIILGAGGHAGDTTVLILEPFEKVRARALHNDPTIERFIDDLYAIDDFMLSDYHFTPDQQAVLAAHGIAPDADLMATQVDRATLSPI